MKKETKHIDKEDLKFKIAQHPQNLYSACKAVYGVSGVRKFYVVGAAGYLVEEKDLPRQWQPKKFTGDLDATRFVESLPDTLPLDTLESIVSHFGFRDLSEI